MPAAFSIEYGGGQLVDGGVLAPEGVVGPVSHPEPVHSVTPKYPRAMRKEGTQARCTVRRSNHDKGLVEDVEVMECPEGSQEAAIEAAGDWRFEPMRVGGEAVPSTFVANFDFRL